MSTTTLRRRWRHLSLLQIAGALSVIGFHVGIPYSQSGWIAVELFFVVAGMNMARALDDDQSIWSYALSRAKRFWPEVSLIWWAAVVLVASGLGSPGMLWFMVACPVFQQNLTLPFFEYTFPRDFVFGPLWFVGALLQIQILIFALRNVLLRTRPEITVLISVIAGTLSRFFVAALFGQSRGDLGSREAVALYCLPLTHVEAIMIGLLMGRGCLRGMGRFLLLFCALAVAFGAMNVVLSHGAVSSRSLGFELPLRLNYMHVWGYALLAFAAASLCSPTGPLAVAVEAVKLPRWAEHILSRLSSLTYGAYAFHGIIIATGLNASLFLERPHAPVLRLILFSITVLESFFLAWVFDLMKQAFPKRPLERAGSQQLT